MKSFFSVSVILLLIFTSCQGPEAENTLENNSVLHSEHLESQVKLYEDYWNSNDPALLDSILADDFKRYGNAALEVSGSNELIAMMDMWHMAIPDMKVELKDIRIHGDRAYYHWTSQGTNSGPFQDMPPTGKKSITHGFAILTFNEEGRILKEESYYDSMSLYKAWGYTITPPVVIEASEE